MKTWVNSRTKTEDYTWRTGAKCGLKDPPASIDDGYEKWKFEDCIPWFGLVVSQNEATLYFGNLTTSREDSLGRPIFVHAALQAENPKDVLDLVGFASSLLVREGQLLPKWTAFFSEVFDKGVVGTYPDTSRLIRTESSQESIGHFVYPREDALARDSIAKRLCSGVNLSVPLAVGTTGRSGKGIFERVCCTENTWQTAFFSSSCTMKAELQVAVETPREIKSNTRVIAAAIGAAVIFALLVEAIANLPRGCRKQVTTDDRGSGTNGPKIGGSISSVVTNAQPQVVTGTNAPSNSQAKSDGPAASAPTDMPPQEASVTNALPTGQIDSSGATTNATVQKAAVTNSLKSASARAEKEKTGK